MRVLITGVAGQDGSYLAETLVGRGDDVHGVVRPGSAPNAQLPGVRLHDVDLADDAEVVALLEAVAPDRVYHLAASSFVDGPAAAGDQMSFNVASTFCLLETLSRRTAPTRFLLAGSAEQFAGATTSPQTEATTPAPCSAYGLSKQLSGEAVRFFREQRGLHASTAILYNHESPRRPLRFLSRKLARAAARISRGLDGGVDVGDLDARRDWGWAPDYVDGMVRLMEHDLPRDLIFATGVARSVRQMADAAFAAVDLDAAPHLRVRDALIRPRDVAVRVGDAAAARAALGWAPRMSFEEMMAVMVRSELSRVGGPA